MKYYARLCGLLAIFILTLGVLMAIYVYKNETAPMIIQTVPPAIVLPSSTGKKTINEEENLKMTGERDRVTFVKVQLKKYPQLQQEINTENITRVYTTSARSGVSYFSGGIAWLVEVKDAQKFGMYSYYLVHSELQKKLVFVGSDQATHQTEAPCQVDILKQLQGYIVLSGFCEGYGNGGKKFTSVYKIENGEKVMLSSLSQEKNIVSNQGNALGKLAGIYGVSNPTLMINYSGLRENTESEISAIGYFDLKTGKMEDLIIIE